MSKHRGSVVVRILKVQHALYAILKPFSYVYAIVMYIRRMLWASGLFRQLSAPCPCISVGNISWGGTGKTPVIDWLLDWGREEKLRTVVLSRGYKSDPNTLPLYVKPYNTAREAGDEPLMLALKHPDVAVLVDPNRYRSGKYAIFSLNPGLMILDDGFQHMAVRRNLDLVLISKEDLQEEWNSVIPAGTWREGESALSNASAFIIKANRETMEHLFPLIKARLSKFKRPVFSFVLQPTHLVKVGSGQKVSAEYFAGKEYILICGVGKPKQVLATVEEYIGYPPYKSIVFPDHHRYTFHDINKIHSFNRPVICTMKDLVKLQHLPVNDVWGLHVKTVYNGFLWTEYPFVSWINEWKSNEKKHLVKAFHTQPKMVYHGFDGSKGLTFEDIEKAKEDMSLGDEVSEGRGSLDIGDEVSEDEVSLDIEGEDRHKEDSVLEMTKSEEDPPKDPDVSPNAL